MKNSFIYLLLLVGPCTSVGPCTPVDPNVPSSEWSGKWLLSKSDLPGDSLSINIGTLTLNIDSTFSSTFASFLHKDSVPPSTPISGTWYVIHYNERGDPRTMFLQGSFGMVSFDLYGDKSQKWMRWYYSFNGTRIDLDWQLVQ